MLYVKRGFTPLSGAAANGSLETVELLLQRGARVDTSDDVRSVISFRFPVMRYLPSFRFVGVAFVSILDASRFTSITCVTDRIPNDKGSNVICTA